MNKTARLFCRAVNDLLGGLKAVLQADTSVKHQVFSAPLASAFLRHWWQKGTICAMVWNLMPWLVMRPPARLHPIVWTAACAKSAAPIICPFAKCSSVWYLLLANNQKRCHQALMTAFNVIYWRMWIQKIKDCDRMRLLRPPYKDEGR